MYYRFTRTEKLIIALLSVSIVALGCYWFCILKKNNADATHKNGNNAVYVQPIPRIPLLPSKIIENSSSDRIGSTQLATNNVLLPSVVESHVASNEEPSLSFPEVPLLPAPIIDKISSGDVFLTLWRYNKFEKISDLESPHYDNTKFTVVLVHGLFQSADDEWLANMASRIVDVEPDTEILAVDWSELSLKAKGYSWENIVGDVADAYKQIGSGGDVTSFDWWMRLMGQRSSKQMIDVTNVVKDIPPVAEVAAEYLFGETGLKLQPNRTHVVGFSHGAHVGGLIGRKTGGTLRRLTLLDPSTRIVHIGHVNTFGTGWDRQSAQFTDMYQTSFWAGTGKAYGHKTFKVMEQGAGKDWLPPLRPAEDARRHNYAPKWFASTVGKQFLGYGYSMIIPETVQFQDGNWTGTIIDSLNEND